MAHRFIIDDQTGQLYKDFTGRRLTSAAEILKSERGLTPTLEFYLINVATDTGAVTAQTLTNAQLSVAIGSASTPPDSGFIKASFTQSGTLYESEQLNIESLTAASLESAFNSSIQPVYNVGGLTVDQIGPGKWLLTMKKVGAITGSPSLNVENSDPPSGVEVTSVTTGDSDTRAQWIISLSQLPVATIAGGSFSAVTSGSFSGLSSSIALNTTGMLAAIARDIKLFEFSVIHNNQVLHRSTVEINESLDPTAAGTVVVTSPSLFTLGSNAVNQGETIALSGGLTYDGTTLDAPFLPLAGGTMTGDAVFNDGVKAKFGTDSDLQVYHLSGNNYVSAITGGNLFIQGNTVSLRSVSQENLITATANGAVSLFYDAVKKFETTSLGCTISGKLIVNGDLDVSGTTTTFNSTVVTVDDPVFTVGGDTAPVASDNKDRGIEFRYMRSGESAKVGFFGYSNADDAFKLLTSATNNSEVFSGTLADLKCGNILLADDNKIKLGDDGDLEIFYNTDSFIKSSAELKIASNVIRFLKNDLGEYTANFIGDAGVELFYDGSKTFETISGGCQITGNLGIGGTANELLQIDGTSPKIRLRDTDASGTPYAHFDASDGNILLSADAGNEIASSNIQFAIDGTEAARFDSSGRLGIGYTSMIKELMVNGSILIANNTGFLQYDAQANVATLLNLTTANTLDIGQSSHVDDIHFNIEGTADAMLLNSTGLGIGGTPSYPLVVKSTSATHQVVAVNRPDSDTAALFLGNNSGLNAIISANNSDLLFGKDFGNTFFEGFRLDTNGHLIFASTTYGANTSENYFRIKFENVGGTANDVGIGQSASGSMDFNINPSGSFIWSRGTSGEAMRLNSTGLGIGGTPSARLEITTASQGDTALQVGYTTSTPNLIVGTSTGSTKLEIANGNYHHKFYSRNASGTAVERLAIEGGSDTADIKIINSNLGIGGTANHKLTVFDTNYRLASFERTSGTNGYIVFKDQNTTQDVGIGATTNDLKFRSGNVDHMVLDSSGNLGIGGTPVSKLDISQDDGASHTDFGYDGLTLSAHESASEPSIITFRSANEDANLANSAKIGCITTGTGGAYFGNLVFSTRSGATIAERMRIDSSGNVGIGTTSPQHEIDCDGTIRSTHNIVSSQNYTAFTIGSDRTVDDYGGLNKDYWKIDLRTDGSSTTGGSSQHRYGDLIFSGVDGNDTTFHERLVLRAGGYVGINSSVPSANADLTLGGGELCMAETTTPTADANFGKIYCKSDNKLYFQDGAGTEHEIAFV